MLAKVALSAFRLASSTLPFAMLGQGLRGVLSTRLLVSHGGGCPAIPLLASWTLELVTFPLRRCHQDFDAVSGSAVLVVAGFEQRMSLCLKDVMFFTRSQRAPEPARVRAPRVQYRDFRAGHWFAATRGGVIIDWFWLERPSLEHAHHMILTLRGWVATFLL